MRIFRKENPLQLTPCWGCGATLFQVASDKDSAERWSRMNHTIPTPDNANIKCEHGHDTTQCYVRVCGGCYFFFEVMNGFETLERWEADAKAKKENGNDR